MTKNVIEIGSIHHKTVVVHHATEIVQETGMFPEKEKGHGTIPQNVETDIGTIIAKRKDIGMIIAKRKDIGINGKERIGEIDIERKSDRSGKKGENSWYYC